jgi:hypothetical protein
MLNTRVTEQGAMFITMTGTPSPPFFDQGLLSGFAGSLYCVTTAPTRFLDGFGVTDEGKLCIAPGGVIHSFNQGIPMTADGRMVTQLNVAPWPGDVYVDQIRVGPAGGVYTVDLTPAPEVAFSSAFDNSFDSPATRV